MAFRYAGFKQRCQIGILILLFWVSAFVTKYSPHISTLSGIFT